MISAAPLHCRVCGGPLIEQIPEGDDRERAVCPGCGEIHYINPCLVVGALIEKDDRVLLCRRAIEPAQGLWTPPAGFLEIGESIADGACRETREEALGEVEALAPHSVIDLPHIGQVYYFILAGHVAGEFGAGAESIEVRWFPWPEIPWPELAFPVVDRVLRLRLEDRQLGTCRFHQGTLRFVGEGDRFAAASYRYESAFCHRFEGKTGC